MTLQKFDERVRNLAALGAALPQLVGYVIRNVA
jgi:hypothetical protein